LLRSVVGPLRPDDVEDCDRSTSMAIPSTTARGADPSKPLGSRSSRTRLSEAEHRRLARAMGTRRELTAWGFLLPMYAFFVVFLLIPAVGVVWWSMQSGGLITGSEFVGLDNFVGLPREPLALTAIRNTLLFALMAIPPTLVVAFGVGMLLAHVQRGGAAYRFLVYFPVLVPPVVAALIWIFLTNVDFGLFNTILKALGAKPVTWLGASTALPVLAALDAWRNVGYWAIFFLAGIIGLPEELYQAAELDGAGALQRFRHLTIPLLRRILLFALVVSTIWGLQVFDTPLVLTDGGPGTSTVTVVYQVWRYALGSTFQAGLAAAISLVLLVVILLLTVIQLRALRGREGVG
jgi:ABC-type sugar transport system permease subunit